MAQPTVQLVVDLYDGSSAPACGVTAEFTPSALAGDTPDGPVRAALNRPGGYQSAMLVPTDTAGARTAGWAYYAEFSGVPGLPSSFWFQVPAGPAAYTCTSATPGVFTWTATTQLTSLPNGTGIQLSGSVPAGLLSGVTYFVTGASGSTFSLAGSPGGAALATTSTGSGNLTVTRYNLSALSAAQQPGSTGLQKAANLLDVANAATALTNLGALRKVADTTAAGTALTNGTPTILTWTAPADGNLHTAVISFTLDVSSAMTGGELASTVSAFAGARSYAGQASQPSLGTGLYPGNGTNSSIPTTLTVPPGGTVALKQFTALTAGAATVYAQMWAA